MKSLERTSGAARRSRRRRLPSPSAPRADELFRALADHTRLRILRLLGAGPLCVGDLVAVLDAPQPTVSRHLRYLRRVGLVANHRRGLWMFYQLAEARVALQERLLECVAAAATLVAESDDDARRARLVRRSGGCCPEDNRPAVPTPVRRTR